MKITALWFEEITRPDLSTKKRYGITCGDEKTRIYLETDKDGWKDLMKELRKTMRLTSGKRQVATDAITRIFYEVNQEQ